MDTPPLTTLSRRSSTVSTISTTSSESQNHPSLDLGATILLPPSKDFDLMTYWRARSLDLEVQVATLTSTHKKKDRQLADLTAAKDNLEACLADALATGRRLLTMFKSVTEQLNVAHRAILRLKKSDRAKGKVQQRNMALKAHMRAHVCGREGEREQTLMEALAMANERIGELEGAGQRLLDALEWGSDCEEEDDVEVAEGGERARGSTRLEAELVFRGVLEDETYEEQKELWMDSLEG